MNKKPLFLPQYEDNDFDPKISKDVTKLHGLLDALVNANYSDKKIIHELQCYYKSCCWFAVINKAEKYIYGN